MKKVLFALFLASLVMLVVPEVQAQSNPSGQSLAAGFDACKNISTTGVIGIVNCAIGFFNAGIYIMMSLAVLFTIYGAFQMVASEEKRDSGRQRVIYGVIGLFAMISIWGFVNILMNTFGVGGANLEPKDAPRIKNI
jgi:hypothetical protein